jgi:hypothetical protein
MSAAVTLQKYSLEEAPLSSESREVASTVQRLLRIGSEMGASTPMTEAGQAEPAVLSHGLGEQFDQLANAWREQTRYLSSTHEIVLHPAYQRIIGMGPDALRFIFRELETSPDHWFWALSAIAGEDPVPPEDKGDLRAMAHHWLQWARRRGFGSAW